MFARALFSLVLMLVPATGRAAALPDGVCCERTVIRAEGFAPIQPIHTAQTAAGIALAAPLEAGPPPGPRSPGPPDRGAVPACDRNSRADAIRIREIARRDRLDDIDLVRCGRLPALSNTPPPAL